MAKADFGTGWKDYVWVFPDGRLDPYGPPSFSMDFVDKDNDGRDDRQDSRDAQSAPYVGAFEMEVSRETHPHLYDNKVHAGNSKGNYELRPELVQGQYFQAGDEAYVVPDYRTGEKPDTSHLLGAKAGVVDEDDPDRQRRAGLMPGNDGGFFGLGGGDDEDGDYGIFSDIISGVSGIAKGLLGKDGLNLAQAYMANEANTDAITKFNEIARKLRDEGNNKKEEWVEKSRGALKQKPIYGEPDEDGVRHIIGYEGERDKQWVGKQPTVMPLGNGQFGVDLNGDGTVDPTDAALEGSRQAGLIEGRNLTFASEEEARDYIEDIGDTVDYFEELEGQTPFTMDIDDVTLNDQNQLRKIIARIPSPEDRKKFIDQVKAFTDAMADSSSDFIKSAMSDEDIVGHDGEKVESISKARTALIQSLNTIMGDVADSITLADRIGSGAVTDADIARAIDVGDALETSAKEVSDQDYFRALAVVAANEEKYDLLRAASKEAQLDIYNKLEAERHQGGFTGLSTRHTRDLAREFLANNTQLAMKLSDINIENTKVLGDAHVRRARLQGEAATKATELEGDARIRGAETERRVGIEGEERAGKADIAGAENLIQDKDYITNLRDKMKFQGFKQEEYQLLRPKMQDDALASGVITAHKLMEPYRIGEANYGTPDQAKQMMPKQWDWWQQAMDVLAGDKQPGNGETIGSIWKKVEDLLKGKKPDLSGDDPSKGPANEPLKKKPFEPPVQDPKIDPKTGKVIVVDADGNEVDDQVDVNDDGKVDESDKVVYNKETGKYEDGNGNPVGDSEDAVGTQNKKFNHDNEAAKSGITVISGPELDSNGNPVNTDADGNEVGDSPDVNGDGVVDASDIIYYDEETGDYYTLDENGNRVSATEAPLTEREVTPPEVEHKEAVKVPVSSGEHREAEEPAIPPMARGDGSVSYDGGKTWVTPEGARGTPRRKPEIEESVHLANEVFAHMTPGELEQAFDEGLLSMEEYTRFRGMGGTGVGFNNEAQEPYVMGIDGTGYTQEEWHAMTPEQQAGITIAGGPMDKDPTTTGVYDSMGSHPVTGETYGNEGFTRAYAKYNPATGGYDLYKRQRPVFGNADGTPPEGYSEADYVGDDPDTGQPIYSKELPHTHPDGTPIIGLTEGDLSAEGYEVKGELAPAVEQPVDPATTAGVTDETQLPEWDGVSELPELGDLSGDLAGQKSELGSNQNLVNSGNAGGNTMVQTFQDAGGQAGANLAGQLGNESIGATPNLDNGDGSLGSYADNSYVPDNSNLFAGGNEANATVGLGEIDLFGDEEDWLLED